MDLAGWRAGRRAGCERGDGEGRNVERDFKVAVVIERKVTSVWC